jgi:hypothetical protein
VRYEGHRNVRRRDVESELQPVEAVFDPAEDAWLELACVPHLTELGIGRNQLVEGVGVELRRGLD